MNANMHKAAPPGPDIRNKSHPVPAPRPVSDSDGAKSKPEEGVHRRDFIKRTGLAVAGLTTASSFLASVRRGAAAGTSPTEITFSSAKFYGKETIAEVVQAF